MTVASAGNGWDCSTYIPTTTGSGAPVARAATGGSGPLGVSGARYVVRRTGPAGAMQSATSNVSTDLTAGQQSTIEVVWCIGN